MKLTTLPPKHTSEETAYLVDDYPCGFTLRCKIRYWLEYSEKRGYRLWTQTTNPKRGDTWNKPKKVTYALIAAVMGLNEDDHLKWDSLSEYSDAKEAQAFMDAYREGLNERGVKRLQDWIDAKVLYEKMVEDGDIKWTIKSSGPIRVL